MKEDKSLLGKLKSMFQVKEEEPKPHWNSKDWIEIKAPRDYPLPPIKPSHTEQLSTTPTHSLRGPAVPHSAHVVRPLTKDRIQSERTTYSGRDPAKPVERMSPDDLKKKWPGAFDQKR